MPADACSVKTYPQPLPQQREGALENKTLMENKQFEYKVISSVVGTEKKLNKLGFEGWELVAVFDCRLYLKREYKG